VHDAVFASMDQRVVYMLNKLFDGISHFKIFCKFIFLERLSICFPCFSDTLRDLNFLLICKTMTILWTCGALAACLLEW
jgi:hypothetical protein